MQFFIDTEFNQTGGQLLSLALVPLIPSEDSFYEQLIVTEPLKDWIVENVMPVMDPDKGFISMDELRLRLKAYLSNKGDIHIVADHPSDIKYLMDVLITGMKGETLDVFPITMSVDQGIEYLSAVPHNALADALAMRDHPL